MYDDYSHHIYFVNDEQRTNKREKKRTSTPPPQLRRNPPRSVRTNNVEMNTDDKLIVVPQAVVPPYLPAIQPRKFKETKFTEVRPGFKTFDERFEDLKAFQAEHGHTNVHKKMNTSLFYWCANMRAAKRNPGKNNALVDADRIAALDSIGFSWERPCQHGHGYRAVGNASTILATATTTTADIGADKVLQDVLRKSADPLPFGAGHWQGEPPQSSMSS